MTFFPEALYEFREDYLVIIEMNVYFIGFQVSHQGLLDLNASILTFLESSLKYPLKKFGNFGLASIKLCSNDPLVLFNTKFESIVILK